mmetsp:Transcript_106789/g.228039  ORF Transcript_106789/g.228039 Transcript_106789/m.228039 type:complete len:233 (+) Transcript_106789:291-989(+)
MRLGVVVLAAVEVVAVAGAATETHSPEVVGVEGQQSARAGARDGDRRNTEGVKVFKAHRFPEVEPGRVGEANPAGVHELLASHSCWRHIAVFVEVVVVVIRLQVGPVVEITEHDSTDPSDEHGQEKKHEPVRLRPLAWEHFLPHRPEREPAANEHCHKRNRVKDPSQPGPSVVSRKRRRGVYEDEEEPRDEEGLADRDHVHSHSLAAVVEYLALSARGAPRKAAKAAVELRP